jgi:hypothetical protein
MMPCSRCWPSLQLTGYADFWHPTDASDVPKDMTRRRPYPGSATTASGTWHLGTAVGSVHAPAVDQGISPSERATLLSGSSTGSRRPAA